MKRNRSFCTHLLTHSFTHSLTDSFTYSLTHSLTHSLTQVLSPYLKFGCLSPARFYHSLSAIYARMPARQPGQPQVTLHGQLLWREFFYFSSATTPNFDKMEVSLLTSSSLSSPSSSSSSLSSYHHHHYQHHIIIISSSYHHHYHHHYVLPSSYIYACFDSFLILISFDCFVIHRLYYLSLLPSLAPSTAPSTAS